METSNLWQRCLGNDATHKSVQKLGTSLRDAREKLKLLTNQVGNALPGLTLHDVSHLDALWDVADVIAGDNFPLNPLEAYVFGCAVLLHDAGLCFEAFEGGQEAVRQTVQWRDARQRLASSGISDNLDQDADFEALRALHAKQAEHLATRVWQSDDQTTSYIIDDSDLRDHYGLLIGKIAGSHHWDVEELAVEFAEQRPAAAILGADWPVDALKIACLLRAADAGHIDGRRAPSFLLKILQMNSLSRDHWVAQNHLGRLMISQQDPTLLNVSSTSPFMRTEVQAWWVAFDAIALFDKEIRACNDLLRSTGRPCFAVSRVAGAGRVLEMAKYIQTLGWEPVESNIHVSDVAALVSSLGGENLYGKDADRLEIALRELVQNAADAVSARQALDESYNNGQLTVRLIGKPNALILQVDYNVIVISQTSLTKDLMDFGKSFWASERVGQEFPGLQSSGYSPIGQFGIGFFSVFMAADKVNVFSRRFDSGLDKVRSLSFEYGVSLRPVVSDERPNDMSMNTSTRIELKLKQDVLDNPNRIPVRSNEIGRNRLHVTLSDYVAVLVSGLGVPVNVEVMDTRQRVHEGFPPRPDRQEEWLRTISYASTSANDRFLPLVSTAAPRLREIRDEKRCYGLAALAVSAPPHGSFLSLKSVGGVGTPHHPQQDDSFVGLIDCFPANAQRSPGEIRAPKSVVRSWLAEQVELLHTMDMPPQEWIYASYSVRDFQCDPKDIMRYILVLDGDKPTFWSVASLGSKLENGARLVFPTVKLSGRTLDSNVRGLPSSQDVFPCIAIRTGAFNDADLADDVPREPQSLVGVIHRTLVGEGRDPKWRLLEDVYQSLVCRGDYLEVIV